MTDPVLIHLNSLGPTTSWFEPFARRSLLDCAYFSRNGPIWIWRERVTGRYTCRSNIGLQAGPLLRDSGRVTGEGYRDLWIGLLYSTMNKARVYLGPLLRSPELQQTTPSKCSYLVLQSRVFFLPQSFTNHQLSHSTSLKLIKMKNNSALFAAGVLAQYASLAAAHSIFQQAGSGSTDFGTDCTRMPVCEVLVFYFQYLSD